MQEEFKKAEEELKNKNEAVTEAWKKVQRLVKGQEAFDVLYANKKSDTMTLEQAELYHKRYPNINESNYYKAAELTEEARNEYDLIKYEAKELEKEVKALSGAISIAEQVRAGTYVQELVSKENIRRNADVFPN